MRSRVEKKIFKKQKKKKKKKSQKTPPPPPPKARLTSGLVHFHDGRGWGEGVGRAAQGGRRKVTGSR